MLSLVTLMMNKLQSFNLITDKCFLLFPGSCLKVLAINYRSEIWVFQKKCRKSLSKSQAPLTGDIKQQAQGIGSPGQADPLVTGKYLPVCTKGLRQEFHCSRSRSRYDRGSALLTNLRSAKQELIAQEQIKLIQVWLMVYCIVGTWENPFIFSWSVSKPQFNRLCIY